MNKQQIKAELRRSACEDKTPWRNISLSAFYFAADEAEYCGSQMLISTPHNTIRIFFLLLSESL